MTASSLSITERRRPSVASFVIPSLLDPIRLMSVIIITLYSRNSKVVKDNELSMQICLSSAIVCLYAQLMSNWASTHAISLNYLYSESTARFVGMAERITLPDAIREIILQYAPSKDHTGNWIVPILPHTLPTLTRDQLSGSSLAALIHRSVMSRCPSLDLILETLLTFLHPDYCSLNTKTYPAPGSSFGPYNPQWNSPSTRPDNRISVISAPYIRTYETLLPNADNKHTTTKAAQDKGNKRWDNVDFFLREICTLMFHSRFFKFNVEYVLPLHSTTGYQVPARRSTFSSAQPK